MGGEFRINHMQSGRRTIPKAISMLPSSIRRTLVIAAASLGLAGCVTDDYGYGGGYGYYDSGYPMSYGGSPYYGWYDGYYYPGTGYYVYDRSGGRRSWNDNQRRYWEGRRVSRGDRRELRENWRGYRTDRRGDRAQFRGERRQNREAFRSGQINREQFREQRRANRQEFRQERREDRRTLRRENRRDRRD